MSFVSLSSTAFDLSSEGIQVIIPDSIPQDSVTFSRANAEYLTIALLERDKLREEKAEHERIKVALISAIDAKELELRTCEEEKTIILLVNDELRLSDETCDTHIQLWKDESKRQKKNGIMVGGGGILLGLLLNLVGR